jgi:hypothetical protein
MADASAGSEPAPQGAGLDPSVFTRFMLRLGAERSAAKRNGDSIVRVRLNPRARAYLATLSQALYGRDLDDRLDVHVVDDDSLELSDLRVETF